MIIDAVIYGPTPNAINDNCVRPPPENNDRNAKNWLFARNRDN